MSRDQKIARIASLERVAGFLRKKAEEFLDLQDAAKYRIAASLYLEEAEEIRSTL